jgi:hypothetical protein
MNTGQCFGWFLGRTSKCFVGVRQFRIVRSANALERLKARVFGFPGSKHAAFQPSAPALSNRSRLRLDGEGSC